MLTEAYRRQLLQTKSYVFIHIDFEYTTSYANMVTPELPTVPDLMEKALHGLLSITVTRPNASDPNYTSFEKDVRERVALPPFNNKQVTNSTIVSSKPYISSVLVFFLAISKVRGSDENVENMLLKP